LNSRLGSVRLALPTIFRLPPNELKEMRVADLPSRQGIEISRYFN
jgi:hypothetical protein